MSNASIRRITGEDLLMAGWHKVCHSASNETLWHHPQVLHGQTFHAAVKYYKEVFSKEEPTNDR